MSTKVTVERTAPKRAYGDPNPPVIVKMLPEECNVNNKARARTGNRRVRGHHERYFPDSANENIDPYLRAYNLLNGTFQAETNKLSSNKNVPL